MNYSPPYKKNSTIIDLVSRITDALDRISPQQEPEILRQNRIRTIQGFLAIEGNSLTENQILAIQEGGTVAASEEEIKEVRNAINAYESYSLWDPSSEKDLLKAHKILTTGLLPSPGSYRGKGAGVMGKGSIIHVAPPADRVPFLMKDLLNWIALSEEHPLISSSVFHYEFEFIHPFEDGNGRLGRLWQTLIMTRWNPLFHDIPVESRVYTHQQDYYRAINESSARGEGTPFIEFMLDVICREVLDITFIK